MNGKSEELILYIYIYIIYIIYRHFLGVRQSYKQLQHCNNCNRLGDSARRKAGVVIRLSRTLLGASMGVVEVLVDKVLE